MMLRDLIVSASRSSLSDLLDSVCDLVAGSHAFRGFSIALNGQEGVVQGRSALFRSFSDDDWQSLRARVHPHTAATPTLRIGDRIAVRYAAEESALMLHAEAEREGSATGQMMAIGLEATTHEGRITTAHAMARLLRTIIAHASEFKTSQTTKSRLQRMLAAVETLANIGFWQVDGATRRLDWSDEIYRLHGLEPDDDPDIETALAFYPEPARSALREHLEGLLKRGDGFDLTLPMVRADGESRIVRTIGESEIEGGRIRNIFGIFQDVTSHAQRDEELWWTANHDPLTRLPNRRLYSERLAAACEEAKESDCFGVAIIADLDSFKVINDVHGHHVGDRVLAAVAERLHGVAPIAGRLGGDEFGLVVHGFSTRQEAERAARHLVRQIGFEFSHEAQQVPITATAGAYVFSAAESDAAEALRNADIALIHAKRRGRRQVAFYESRFGEELIRRDQVLTRMRSALSRSGVLPYYQPQVDAASGKVIGVEVLARQVLDGEVTAAADFGVAFADGELAVSIGRTILAAVCRDHRELRRRGIHPPRMSINVAPTEICYPDYTRYLLAQFDAFGVPPGDVLVEITEDVLLGRDQDEAHEALDELAHGGIRVAFDDFGTGYASLIHLASYPVHQVKIDKRFISEIVSDPVSQAVVRGVVEVSRARAIEVAAEGVETARQLAMLRAIGCDVVQGYHIARPMPFEELATLLTGLPSGAN